jgi:hypothetical protein
MKKVVRTVWISTLSGLAFLAACCSTNGLTKEERKQLKRDRDSIQEALKMHQMATPEDNPVAVAEFEAEAYRLQYELDSINNRLKGNIDMEKSKKRYALQQRLVELQTALSYREGACVYGSPEIIKKYGEETQRMRREMEDVQNQIKELDN